MKKAITVALTIGLLAGSLAMPAEAAKKKKKKVQRIERVVEFEYVCPCPGVIQIGTLTGGDPNLGGGAISVGPDDRYITITAADQSGTAVQVGVRQDDGTGANAPTGDICATDEKGEPLALVPGMEIRLFIGTGSCGVPLGGTLTVTLSNMP